MSDNTRGFTLTELIIAVSLASAMAIVLFGVTILLYGGVIQNMVRANMTDESQTILRSVVDDLRISSAIEQTNQISDPNAPVGGWNTSSANAILIMSTPALDSSSNFIIDPNTGKPYQNEKVLFATNNILYRRTLANPSAPGNVAKTTCPAALATPSCPADTVLSKDYKLMTFSFFDQDNIPTTTLPNARSIKIDIALQRKTLGATINVNNSMQVTMRNSP